MQNLPGPLTSMPAATATDGSAQAAASPARNFSFWAKRSVVLVLAVLLVAYGTHGVMSDTLVLPAKGGGTFGFHGYPGWVCYLALLVFAATMLTEAFGEESPKGNGRAVRILGACSLLLILLAVALEIHSSNKAYVCTDIEDTRIVSPEKRVFAVIFRRFCAEHDPMASKDPVLMIMIAREGETLRGNPQRTSVIWMNDNDIDGVSWAQGQLLVRYRAREHVKKGRAPLASSDFPVPVVLVRQ